MTTVHILKLNIRIYGSKTYSPQLIVKTLPDKPEIFKPYRLQCNTRGNPLPKLVWSKNTRQFRSSKAYAKNPMNKTQASITLAFDPVHKNPLEHYSKRKNSTCDFLDRCYDRGQCIILEKKLQCLCEKNFFGDRCEHSYDEMVKKHSNELLLFKSRFITSVMLGIVLVLLMTLGLISWLLSRAGKRHFKSQKTVSDIETVKDKKKDEDVVKNVNHIVEPPSSALLKNSTSIDNKLTANIQPKTIASVLPVPTEPNIVPDRTENKTLKINAFVPNNVKSVLPSSSQKPVLLNKSYFTDTSTNDEEDGDDFNDYDPDAILKRARTFSSQKETPIDEYEERFSFKMNNSEIHGLSNDIVLAEDYHYCLDDNGLIKPLESSSSRRMMIQPPPTRFTKYVSSRFVLPTPVNRN
ncbi:unnamed protein product [Didymodactylos carnosus]|uniref:EGF-like domain-containing protein n=1 Tax=Didymodactylos carnosus TaxID=1234261 RepID=A0A8S2DMN3_9BILA|nr:unnamed protein product [Didymodactylos carnosus]CAF3706110.1 unnamed protein product [Didymodactylos carnosus]